MKNKRAVDPIDLILGETIFHDRFGNLKKGYRIEKIKKPEQLEFQLDEVNQMTFAADALTGRESYKKRIECAVERYARRELTWDEQQRLKK